MRKNQSLPANASLNHQRVPKTAEEEEEETMKRIFDLVPRRRRSHRGPKKETPVFSRVPIKKRIADTYTTTPKWLLRLKKEMKIADDPMLILEKTLELDDVDPRENRLLVPFESLKRSDFLTSDELNILGDESINNDGRMGVGAFLVDQRTKQWSVVLKKWVLTTETGEISRSLLLSGEWKDVIEANGLRDDDNISLWSFRRHGILFFALDFAGDAIDFLE
ncbi:unnamed protein product [Thlaspi arvense]|uniref:TF-B3 domain-containing protein n=1 Tax=Thlaspi arvense TaxID=13288 RepID=A0AAU9RIM7_THLAR|nr:unnamed protein product [Thlaspi arvense]